MEVYISICIHQRRCTVRAASQWWDLTASAAVYVDADTSRQQHHVDASTASVLIIIMHRHTDVSSYTAYLRPFFLFISSVFANAIFVIRRRSPPGQQPLPQRSLAFGEKLLGIQLPNYSSKINNYDHRRSQDFRGGGAFISVVSFSGMGF